MSEQAICPKCHATLEGDPQDPERCEECYQNTATFCDSCGREIPPGDSFCDECQEMRDDIAAEEAGIYDDLAAEDAPTEETEP